MLVEVELTAGESPTLDHIRGMAPDHVALRGGGDLARGDGWDVVASAALASGARLLWAVFPEARRADIQTKALLPQLRVSCTCNATRFPCRHILALFLRDEAAPLPAGDPPDWAADWAAGLGRAGPFDTPADPATEAQRLAALAAGMADLSRWLNDLIRQGLSTLPRHNHRWWAHAADRLVDAYAFEAARDLRELGAISGRSPDWPERILPRLGRLALMAASFRRLEELPLPLRGDLQAAAGWPPRPAGDRQPDDWRVLGRRQEVESGQRRLRTWLRGVCSGRWALLPESRPASRLEGTAYTTGALFNGELDFSPAAWPLLARPAVELRLLPGGASDTEEAAAVDVAAAISGFAAARAVNPWLRLYPMLLRDVFLEPPAPVAAGDTWRVRDRVGHWLPLPPRFGHGWQLLALSGDRPLTLFGEWDGATLTPLSVAHAGWRDLAMWKSLV
jgi:hypothetical protein